MIRTRSVDHEVVGTISAVQQIDGGSPPRSVFVVDLLGEIVASGEGQSEFRRGVSHYPISGAPVRDASDADLRTIYTRPSVTNVAIGTLFHDPNRQAFVLVDELLAKNFAVLGSTGSGKSCGVALILSAVLAGHPQAHIVVLDPHNEYAAAFGDLSEIFNVDNLQLPRWLLDFEEAAGVLIRGGTAQEQEAQSLILKEAITRARRHYASEGLAALSITVDTPAPFGVPDLLRFIDEAMGRLNAPDHSAPYLRLRSRIESLRDDRRFAFMFADWLVTRDTLAQIVGRLLRIPVNGRPITVIDLSGIPSEIADVVVSLTCRLTFDFSLWSERERRPPVLMVCEEAHRYGPGSPVRRLCRGRAGDYKDCQGGTQIWCGARVDLTAALGALAPGALPVRYGLRAAARALPRPTVHGNRATGCRARDVGIPAKHAHAGGDRFRRRGPTTDAYSLRRPAARASAAQRQRAVLQSLADGICRR
jgi:hypothetical protein